MARRPKSPTRTISNRGEYPRFIGYFPCTKGAKDRLLFDSISALNVGIYLEWLPRVQRLDFEPRRHAIADGDKPFNCIPDYEATTLHGEVEVYEGKYSPDNVSDKSRTRLSAISRTMARQGYRYQVLYRKILERRGFIQTISKLRHYGQLTFPDPVLRHALAVLASATPRTLGQYVSTALDNGIRVGVLYHLAYHRKLRLRYELPRHMELELCRV